MCQQKRTQKSCQDLGHDCSIDVSENQALAKETIKCPDCGQLWAARIEYRGCAEVIVCKPINKTPAAHERGNRKCHIERKFKMKTGIVISSIAMVVLCVLIAFGLYGYPKYNVWQKSLKGQAELKQAEWNRQIAIKEAEAKKEAAIALAAAEIERAKGVAEANKIIGDSLQGNEAYLRYLWIMGLQDGSSEVIYVPTEAQLPILEASKQAIK